MYRSLWPLQSSISQVRVCKSWILRTLSLLSVPTIPKAASLKVAWPTQSTVVVLMTTHNRHRDIRVKRESHKVRSTRPTDLTKRLARSDSWFQGHPLWRRPSRKESTDLCRVQLPCVRFDSFRRAPILSFQGFLSRDWSEISVVRSRKKSDSHHKAWLPSKKAWSPTCQACLKTLTFVRFMPRELHWCQKTCN